MLFFLLISVNCFTCKVFILFVFYFYFFSPNRNCSTVTCAWNTRGLETIFPFQRRIHSSYFRGRCADFYQQRCCYVRHIACRFVCVLLLLIMAKLVLQCVELNLKINSTFQKSNRCYLKCINILLNLIFFLSDLQQWSVRKGRRK